MLALKQLSIGYHHSAPIVQAMDAELCDDTFCCLLGRNGSGKSTLLRTIAQLQKPLAGGIETPSNIGIVLTQVPDLANTTVRQMVASGRLGYTDWLGTITSEDYRQADEAIAQVGIKELRNRLFCSLSDGERQKTMIARAIAQASPLLLLDEPSAFLDYPSRRELMQLLKQLAHDNGKSILLSTHDVELAIEYADVLWVLKEGTLQSVDPKKFLPEEL